MSEKNRLCDESIWEKTTRPTYAKIEFRAVQPLVEQKLAEGYSIKLIFDTLTRVGSLTMGYTSFCDYVRGKGDRLHSLKKSSQKQTSNMNRSAVSQSDQKKRNLADKNEPFIIEKCSLEELVHGKKPESEGGA